MLKGQSKKIRKIVIVAANTQQTRLDFVSDPQAYVMPTSAIKVNGFFTMQSNLQQYMHIDDTTWTADSVFTFEILVCRIYNMIPGAWRDGKGFEICIVSLKFESGRASL